MIASLLSTMSTMHHLKKLQPRTIDGRALSHTQPHNKEDEDLEVVY